MMIWCDALTSQSPQVAAPTTTAAFACWAWVLDWNTRDFTTLWNSLSWAHKSCMPHATVFNYMFLSWLARCLHFMLNAFSLGSNCIASCGFFSPTMEVIQPLQERKDHHDPLWWQGWLWVHAILCNQFVKMHSRLTGSNRQHFIPLPGNLATAVAPHRCHASFGRKHVASPLPLHGVLETRQRLLTATYNIGVQCRIYNVRDWNIIWRNAT